MSGFNDIADSLKQILDELRFQRGEDQSLWDADDIGRYLKLAKSSVQNRIIRLPDFPRSIRTPTESGKGGRRWIAREVKQWALKHREPVLAPSRKCR